MYLKTLFIALFLILVCQSSGFAQVSAAPQVLKQTLSVRTYRDSTFWKVPESNTWSWMPGMEFYVAGDLPDASFFNIEFTMPDGKTWFASDVNVTKASTGQPTYVVLPVSSQHGDKRNIIDTGVFGFKITLKNGLSGASRELYRGKFTVKKFHVGNNLPAFKNQYEYYVDHDWTLPIGYVWEKPDATAIGAMMWFRGENVNKLEGYLLYNGKQISSTKDTSSAVSDFKIMTSGNDVEPRWENWKFIFYGFDGSKPGNYEVKVLSDGELSRSLSFTVGADGKIVDSGIGGKNGFFYTNILPVKIVDTKAAPAYNPNAYKTEAFYGNPLGGFTAIP